MNCFIIATLIKSLFISKKYLAKLTADKVSYNDRPFACKISDRHQKEFMLIADQIMFGISLKFLGFPLLSCHTYHVLSSSVSNKTLLSLRTPLIAVCLAIHRVKQRGLIVTPVLSGYASACEKRLALLGENFINLAISVTTSRASHKNTSCLL